VIKRQPEVKLNFFAWNSSTLETQGMSSQVLDSAFIQAQQIGFVDGLLPAGRRMVINWCLPARDPAIGIYG
jgi:hypothetical protein